MIDGILKFQTLVDYFDSYALVEVSLLLLVILPTWAVYKFTKKNSDGKCTAILSDSYQYPDLCCLWY